MIKKKSSGGAKNCRGLNATLLALVKLAAACSASIPFQMFLRAAALLLYFGVRRRRSMTREELLARIAIDPKVCFGKPCIKGHRIWVSLILDLLAGGMTIQQVG